MSYRRARKCTWRAFRVRIQHKPRRRYWIVRGRLWTTTRDRGQPPMRWRLRLHIRWGAYEPADTQEIWTSSWGQNCSGAAPFVSLDEEERTPEQVYIFARGFDASTRDDFANVWDKWRRLECPSTLAVLFGETETTRLRGSSGYIRFCILASQVKYSYLKNIRLLRRLSLCIRSKKIYMLVSLTPIKGSLQKIDIRKRFHAGYGIRTRELLRDRILSPAPLASLATQADRKSTISDLRVDFSPVFEPLLLPYHLIEYKYFPDALFWILSPETYIMFQKIENHDQGLTSWVQQEIMIPCNFPLGYASLLILRTYVGVFQILRKQNHYVAMLLRILRRFQVIREKATQKRSLPHTTLIFYQ